jgi:hypothetical protein
MKWNFYYKNELQKFIEFFKIKKLFGEPGNVLIKDDNKINCSTCKYYYNCISEKNDLKKLCFEGEKYDPTKI